METLNSKLDAKVSDKKAIYKAYDEVLMHSQRLWVMEGILLYNLNVNILLDIA